MLLLLGTAIIGAAVPLQSGAQSGPLAMPGTEASHHCPPISRTEARQPPGKPEFHHLNELPAADAYRAVYRRIGGCIAPVIVRYGIGNR